MARTDIGPLLARSAEARRGSKEDSPSTRQVTLIYRSKSIDEQDSRKSVVSLAIFLVSLIFLLLYRYSIYSKDIYDVQ